MKKIALLSFALLAMTACNDRKDNSMKNSQEQIGGEGPLVGGAKDQHGCLTAAGETWSEVNHDCVKIFEIGQGLNPIKTDGGEAIISAFVLFNDDRSKLELFLPDQKKTIVLEQDGTGTYQKDSWKFDTEDSTLYLNGEMRYRAE